MLGFLPAQGEVNTFLSHAGISRLQQVPGQWSVALWRAGLEKGHDSARVRPVCGGWYPLPNCLLPQRTKVRRA